MMGRPEQYCDSWRPLMGSERLQAGQAFVICDVGPVSPRFFSEYRISIWSHTWTCKICSHALCERVHFRIVPIAESRSKRLQLSFLPSAAELRCMFYAWLSQCIKNKS